MARKRPQRSAYPSRIANGVAQIQHLSLSDLISPLPSLTINTPEVRSALSEVEDLRYWHPERVPSPRGSRGLARTEEVYSPKRPSGPTRPLSKIHALSFRSPKFVAVCVRRNARKEVLHALGKTGKGGGFKKKPRRNYWSNVRC